MKVDGISTEDVPVELEFLYLPRINFSLQHNAISVIRSIQLSNIRFTDLNDVRCRISSTPDFFEPVIQMVDRIPAGGVCRLGEVAIRPYYKYLTELSERVSGTIDVCITGADGASQTERELLKKAFPVTVFPFDEWFGSGVMPDMLASFVTPNLDIVSQILRKISAILEGNTGNGGIDGYQSKDKRRVYAIIKAAYEAVAGQSVTYAPPPASFEKNGQRIRFADVILSRKLATCLDLSLLFAGILEQCGLNPLILLHEGHAYSGCHLTEYCFPDSVIDDLQSIRKRVELDEIVVFECTGASSNTLSFSEAESAGQKHLAMDRIFILALDVRHARTKGIIPLPLKKGSNGYHIDGPDSADDVVETDAVKSTERSLRAEILISAGEDKKGRISRWQQKLLDLSLRNRLLNFRETKQTIKIAHLAPEMLEDHLSSGSIFTINPVVPLLSGSDPRNLEVLEKQTGGNPVRRYLEEEFSHRRLRSYLTDNELLKRLLNLYRQSRTDFEEGGINTLFLSVGFLEWRETAASEQTYRAPLLLLPVKLERKSVQEGYRLERIDEDAIINVTLLEMLRRDFNKSVPGIDPLPADERGVDVARIFQLFRQEMKNLRGWEVTNEVWLGCFSFNKFIMWNDLNSRLNDLQKNLVVNHLINHSSERFDDGIDGVNPEDLDRTVSHKQIYAPLSYDSSQLSAVLSAEKGKNFVLHGPPGTGKSQTIANMIAHCLAVGKRVLFVAEKRAALEVVHRRLCNIGLRPFCLELHSNKAGKKDVLAQFGEALDFVENGEPGEWPNVAGQLDESRKILNEYADSLHHVYPGGFTPYRVLSYLMCHEEDEKRIGDVGKIEIISVLSENARQNLGKIRESAEALRAVAVILTRGTAKSLSFIRNREWTPLWQEDVLAVAKEMKLRAAELKQICLGFFPKLGYRGTVWSYGDIHNLASLAETLKDAPSLPAGFVKREWSSFAKMAEIVIDAGLKRDDALVRLKDFHTELVASVNTDGIRVRLQENARKFFLIRYFRNHSLLAELQPLKKLGGSRLRMEEMDEMLRMFDQLTESVRPIADADSAMFEIFGSLWNGGNADWDAIRSASDFGKRLHSSLTAFVAGDVNIRKTVADKIGEMLPLSAEALGKDSPMRKEINDLIQRCNNFQDALNRFLSTLGLGKELMNNQENLLEKCIGTADAVIDNIGELRNWCMWLKRREDAEKSGLNSVVTALESGLLDPRHIGMAVEKRYRERFMEEVIEHDPVLRNFCGPVHDSLVSQFHRLDKLYGDLAATVIIARIAARLPNGRKGQCPNGTELGILKREIEKRSRHKAVRVLMESIPNILTSLKPCMLMSPLSVAQYLPAGQDRFDIVIFDEASQIPVWDAVGAIARGRQVIVVGDPKQLPPTSFFQRQDDEGGREDEVEEMESILDECIAAQIPESYLRWHYRSRHESLISFSNYHYYKNLLLTFPSAGGNNRLGVRFHHVVDGVYDRSGSRTNGREAASLVKAVVERLRNPDCSGKSIGIVTFSQAQKILIEDLLDDSRREYPEIERFFDDALPEPVFVKNLENVQGDERDVIYFSICYGPGENGKVSMNFGPLNRNGGERRLNVAVTRAKEEVIIFSSVLPENLDVTRTNADGAKHLRYFLEFAKKGTVNFSAENRFADSNIHDSSFEEEVAQFLRSRGYEVDTQIGCSGYRIDMAVVHPGNPGSYAIGIECDGASYHRSATARDRDRLRQIVLENLGWRICRVWSVSWWYDRTNTRDKLILEVEEALAGINAAKNGSFGEDVSQGFCHGPPIMENPESVGADSTIGPSDTKDDIAFPNPYVRTYPEIRCEPICWQGDFYDPSSVVKIREQMNRIIEREGPIIEALLCRRVVREWGISRIGNNVRGILESAFPMEPAKSTQYGQKVFWPSQTQPAAYDIYRKPDASTSSKRAVDEIPLEEIRNAIHFVLMKYHSCPRDVLFRESAREMGLGSVTGKSVKYYEDALQMLNQSGIAGE